MREAQHLQRPTLQRMTRPHHPHPARKATDAGSLSCPRSPCVARDSHAPAPSPAPPPRSSRPNERPHRSRPGEPTYGPSRPSSPACPRSTRSPPTGTRTRAGARTPSAPPAHGPPPDTRCSRHVARVLVANTRKLPQIGRAKAKTDGSLPVRSRIWPRRGCWRGVGARRAHPCSASGVRAAPEPGARARDTCKHAIGVGELGRDRGHLGREQ
jgi:hypothetical protein